MMDSDKILRKKQRAHLTQLRERCIFSATVTLVIASNSQRATLHKITESHPRDLNLDRLVTLSIVPPTLANLSEQTVDEVYLLVDLDEDVFRIELRNIIISDQSEITGNFSLSTASALNRRTTTRRRENTSYFIPVMVYTSEDHYPVHGYARLVDVDDKAICLNLQFFKRIDQTSLVNAEVQFQERLAGVYATRQRIIRVRNMTCFQQGETWITKVDAILKLSQPVKATPGQLATAQPDKPVTVSFHCLLHDEKIVTANIEELLIDGFFLRISGADLHTLPAYFQADHKPTGLRFNISRREDGIFVSYFGLSLGSKTIWFNYITKNALCYDHCFSSSDAKKIVHLMFESGNYSSQAILKLSLMNDYLQHKWPIEESFSPTKYRWLVRDRNTNYIGHTAGIRVSESLWAAIDNIGSQSYSGSWNAEFVARWIRSFSELLLHSEQSSWVQWTFVPEAGVWTRFDESIKESKELTLTKNQF
jgi:hypothetical protein